MPRGRPRKSFSEDDLRQALEESSGVRSRVAKKLGCSEATLRRELSKVEFNSDGTSDVLLSLDEKIRRRLVGDIKLNEVELSAKGSDHIIIVPFGDIHYGHESCDLVTLKKVLSWLYDNKDVYIIGMGDYMEASITDSPGLFDQEEFVNAQFEEVIDMLMPLANEGRILGLHPGNHERRIKKKTGLDITKIMCSMLGVRYLGKGMLHKVTISGGASLQSYVFYTTHGSSAARYPHTKMAACVKLSEIAEAEVYCMGHVHSLIHSKRERYMVVGDSVEKRSSHYILTGSYLSYWGTYAHEKSMPPSGDSGSPKVKLHVDCHRVSVSV